MSKRSSSSCAVLSDRTNHPPPPKNENDDMERKKVAQDGTMMMMMVPSPGRSVLPTTSSSGIHGDTTVASSSSSSSLSLVKGPPTIVRHYSNCSPQPPPHQTSFHQHPRGTNDDRIYFRINDPVLPRHHHDGCCSTTSTSTSTSTVATSICLLCHECHIFDRREHQSTSRRHLTRKRHLQAILPTTTTHNNSDTNHHHHQYDHYHWYYQSLLRVLSIVSHPSMEGPGRNSSTSSTSSSSGGVRLCPYLWTTLHGIPPRPAPGTLWCVPPRGSSGQMQVAPRTRTLPISSSSSSSSASSSSPPPPVSTVTPNESRHYPKSLPPPPALERSIITSIATDTDGNEPATMTSDSIVPEQQNEQDNNKDDDDDNPILHRHSQMIHHRTQLISPTVATNQTPTTTFGIPTPPSLTTVTSSATSTEMKQDSWHCHLCQVYHLTSNQFWIHCLTDAHTMKITTVQQRKSRRPTIHHDDDNEVVLQLVPPAPPTSTLMIRPRPQNRHGPTHQHNDTDPNARPTSTMMTTTTTASTQNDTMTTPSGPDLIVAATIIPVNVDPVSYNHHTPHHVATGSVSHDPSEDHVPDQGPIIGTIISNDDDAMDQLDSDHFHVTEPEPSSDNTHHHTQHHSTAWMVPHRSNDDVMDDQNLSSSTDGIPEMAHDSHPNRDGHIVPLTTTTDVSHETELFDLEAAVTASQGDSDATVLPSTPPTNVLVSGEEPMATTPLRPSHKIDPIHDDGTHHLGPTPCTTSPVPCDRSVRWATTNSTNPHDQQQQQQQQQQQPTLLLLRGKSLLVGCMVPDVLEEESFEEESVTLNITTNDDDEDTPVLIQRDSDSMSLFGTEPPSDMVTPKSSNIGKHRFEHDNDDDGTSVFVTKNTGNNFWTCQLCNIFNLQGHSVEVHCNGKKHRQALERKLRSHPSSSPMTDDDDVVVARSPRKLLEDCLACQMWIDTTAQTDPRFAYLTYHARNSETSLAPSWSCRLCEPMIHGLNMKDLEPHCLGKKHTCAYQQRISRPPLSPVIRFDHHELTPIKATDNRDFEFRNDTDWDGLPSWTDGVVSTASNAAMERRLSADMMRSMIEHVDPSSNRDRRNLSMCSTGTYYYDAMNGEWLDDDGGTIYQSFLDEDSMLLYNDETEKENNDHGIDTLPSSLDEGDDDAGIDLSMLVGEEYIDKVDTNLDEFCEQLSLELDEMSQLVWASVGIDS